MPARGYEPIARLGLAVPGEPAVQKPTERARRTVGASACLASWQEPRRCSKHRAHDVASRSWFVIEREVGSRTGQQVLQVAQRGNRQAGKTTSAPIQRLPRRQIPLCGARIGTAGTLVTSKVALEHLERFRETQEFGDRSADGMLWVAREVTMKRVCRSRDGNMGPIRPAFLLSLGHGLASRQSRRA